MPRIIEPEDDTVIMSIKLRSGRFESSIEVPLFATEEEKKEFVEKWLDLMAVGIKIGSIRKTK